MHPLDKGILIYYNEGQHTFNKENNYWKSIGICKNSLLTKSLGKKVETCMEGSSKKWGQV